VDNVYTAHSIEFSVAITGTSLIHIPFDHVEDPDPAFQVNPDGVLMTKLEKIQLKKNIMMEKLAQPGGRVGYTAFRYFYHHLQSCGVCSS
jgi:hypothetical protein